MGHFYGPRNVCNRSSILEILFLAPKNTFELLLSSEIDQFQVEKVDFLENPYIFLCTNSREYKGFQWKIIKIDLLDLKLIYLGAQDEFESVPGL